MEQGTRPAGASADPRGAVPGAGDGPINILIVDDEPKNLFVLETLLDSPDYRLVRANSADEALLALIAEEFALIILDINMPGMSGFELAQMIRQRRKTAHVPIIFLTAYYNEDEHVLEGYAAGAVDFLHKPVNKNILRSKVATFADLHRANRALQVEVSERRLAQEQLRAANESLEQHVEAKTLALRATEAQLRAMIDALPAAIYATDAHGYLTHFNPATVELSGRTPEIGVDQWCATWRLFRADGSPLPHDECPMAVALKEGRTIRGAQIIVERPDGERAWVMPYPTPLLDETGAITGGINMLVDITEAKRAEQELSSAKRAAEVANAAKSDFLANMSHEIRTPMNAILGFTHLLSDVVDSPTEREWVLSIKKGGELLLTVINDVLDLSKIEAGKLVLHPQPSTVFDLVDDMVAMFIPQCAEKGITIAVSERTGPAETLLLDSQRLRQVLMNLVSNAVKFTERGGITITATVTDGRTDGLRDLCLVVTDTGVGIPSSHLAHIFEPFRQADSPDGKLRQGTGLGLTISKRLVDAMRGTISVKSTVGEGTTFAVHLPGLEVTQALPSSPQPLDEVDFNALRPLRILAVDDNAWNLQVAKGYLAQSHHELHLANDGLEGVALTKALRPDVVLMDLRMPVMDGYEARNVIRADPTLAGTAIVAVTASTMRSEDGDCQHVFDACVRKPYSPRDLFAALSLLTGTPALATPEPADAGGPASWSEDCQSQWADLQLEQLPALGSRMRMRELGDFAGRLRDFATFCSYPELRVRALALESAVESFDIKAIGESLQRISRLPREFPID